MKIRSLAILALSLCSIGGFSQTTQEEYDYLTKDYVAHYKEKTFEIKKGYEMENLFFNDADTTSITMQRLVKIDGDKKKPVAYLLGYKKGKKPTEFICIPNPKSESSVNNAFWNSLFNKSTNDTEKFQYVVSTMARQMVW